MIYLDASLIVALLVPEAHSERADTWFARQPTGSLLISGWVVTEVSSALSLKLRTEQLSLDRRAAALSAWNALREASFLTLAVTDAHFEAAARIADHYDLGPARRRCAPPCHCTRRRLSPRDVRQAHGGRRTAVRQSGRAGLKAPAPAQRVSPPCLP